MKLKHLESWLSQVDPFQEPKIEYEQYPTPADLAARVLFIAENTYNDIKEKSVIDLGCGTGMLAIGAKIMESP